MNILFVVPDLSIGGAEVTVVNLVNSLAKLGHTISLYECYSNRNETLVRTINNDVQIVSYSPSLGFVKVLNNLWNFFAGQSRLKNKVYHFFQAKHFNSVLKTQNIEIINSHLPSADFFVYMTAKGNLLNKMSWIVSMHGSYENSRKTLPLSKVIFHKVDGVVYLTSRNLNVLDGYKDLNIKSEKIYNCLGDWQFNKEDDPNVSDIELGERFTFGLISRGDYNKGWKEAIEAVILLNEKGIQCNLILAGDGEAQIELEEMYGKLNYIVFVGFVSNPLSLIKKFDVGLLPSYFESLPYTIMEYLHEGIPTIATNVGEIKAMLEMDNGKEQAGIVFDYNKDDNLLSENIYNAMKLYMTDNNLYMTHKANTKLLYKQFNPELWGSRYVAFYQAVHTGLKK